MAAPTLSCSRFITRLVHALNPSVARGSGLRHIRGFEPPTPEGGAGEVLPQMVKGAASAKINTARYRIPPRAIRGNSPPEEGAERPAGHGFKSPRLHQLIFDSRFAD